LREAARLSGKELAAQLGWAPSKVSRLEHGKQAATPADVEAWARAVGAPTKIQDDLIADLSSVRFEYASWQRQLRRGTAARQQANLRLEAEAQLVRVFTPEMVPGLLQTPDYARYVFARLVSLHGIPNDVDASVRMRLRRQDVLYDSSKCFRFLLTEAALRYRICPPAVQRGQLDRLLTLMGLDTVELAVIPFTVTLPVVPSHGFTMFDERLVLVEMVGAELAFRDEAEVRLYAGVFEELWGVGVQGEEARSFIARVTREVG